MINKKACAQPMLICHSPHKITIPPSWAILHIRFRVKYANIICAN